MLERLVAGVIVIGALLWAASTLATPDSASPLDGEASIAPGARDPSDPDAAPEVTVPPPDVTRDDEERDGEDDEPDATSGEGAAEPPTEEPRRRKGKGGDG